jgi:hypothetical protein
MVRTVIRSATCCWKVFLIGRQIYVLTPPVCIFLLTMGVRPLGGLGLTETQCLTPEERKLAMHLRGKRLIRTCRWVGSV